ncbi:hypothetical protein XENOCAPTIV_001669 [Xenoophorus captivus]|uniref:Vomeronasal type-1 receptor n=1 Tax=Xenoophorus captivus TaxID=1517983 RepID=A0ABV0RY74_9TELE
MSHLSMPKAMQGFVLCGFDSFISVHGHKTCISFSSKKPCCVLIELVVALGNLMVCLADWKQLMRYKAGRTVFMICISIGCSILHSLLSILINWSNLEQNKEAKEGATLSWRSSWVAD